MECSLSNITGRGPLGQKAPRPIRGTDAAKAHMARVAGLPCCVCGKPGPSTVHHVICGRYSQRKASDFDTIPLCWNCHMGQFGIHNDRTDWVKRNGPDTGFLDAVRRAIPPAFSG